MKQFESREMMARVATKLFKKAAFSLLVLGVVPVYAIDLGLPGGLSFGTKFACCSPESTSCFDGSGGTLWHKLLGDRALTQVDAQIRCGTSKMFWGTDSCPADVPCSSGSGGGSSSNPNPPASLYQMTFRNNRPNDVFIAVDAKGGPTFHDLAAWYKVPSGQTYTTQYTFGVCVAIEENGQDLIAQEQQNSIFTVPIQTIMVNRYTKTNLIVIPDNHGTFLASLDVPGVFTNTNMPNVTFAGLNNVYQAGKLEAFRCFYTQNSNALFSAD